MSAGYETDTVARLETNLDDCSPERIGAVFRQALAAGALDVWLTPIQMKKQRPGVLLSLLCEEADTTRFADLLFEHTTAFGLRVEKVVRLKLARRFEPVQTEFGEITVKLGLKGDRVLQVAPEFASCEERAAAGGVPLLRVYEAALQAWRAQAEL